MNNKTKRDIRDKARLACGLADILKYDADNLLTDSVDLESLYFVDTLIDTKETLQNFVDTITEIEYLLYLEKLKES